MLWDVFISHASEDKKEFVKPLANKLIAAGLKIWYDEFSLKVGDSLSKKLDEGLADSNFGVIVISQSFISKGWTDYELRSFINREVGYKKVILPVWHNITKEEVQKFSPFLADKYALNTSVSSLDEISLKIIEVARPDIFENLQRHLLFEKLVREGERKTTTDYDLFQSIVYHSKLPNEILNRIELFHKVIGNASGISLKKTVENFKRDLHPERELLVWEAIAVSFLDITRNHSLSGKEIEAEIFRILLGYTMGIAPTETRFAHDKALYTILNSLKKHYPSPPK
jgi:hypothetical protein